MKNLYLSVLILIIIAWLNVGCASNTKSKYVVENSNATQKGGNDTIQKPVALIGYDSLNIFLGSSKGDIEKLIPLKWDKDNDAERDVIGYYTPLQITSVGNLKAHIDPFFTFNKYDTALVRFSVSVDFDNYYRNKIALNLKKELLKKFDYIIDFTPEEILSGKHHEKMYDGYKVKIHLDTASYSPTFYYSIEVVKKGL